jgi:hypothetical protein
LIDHCDEFLVRPRSWEASGGVPANESRFKGKMKPGQVSAKFGRRRIEWQMNCSNQPRVVVLTTASHGGSIIHYLQIPLCHVEKLLICNPFW